MRDGSTGGSPNCAERDHGIVDVDGLRALGATRRQIACSTGRRPARPPSSRGVRVRAQAADERRMVVGGGARHRAGGRAEPHARRGAARAAAAPARSRERDGAEPRPAPAARDPRPRDARPLRRRDDRRRPHPRHDCVAHPRRPRERSGDAGSDARHRGRRVAHPPRRAGGTRRRRGALGGGPARTAPRTGDAPHPQRARGCADRALRRLRDPPADHERPRRRARGGRAVARPQADRRARQLGAPRHPRRVRARPRARRRAARARLHDAALHLRPGHPAAPLGRACARSTFSAWIFFCAPVRRASGSGASAPRSSNASR